jgi:hypothetical protein
MRLPFELRDYFIRRANSIIERTRNNHLQQIDKRRMNIVGSPHRRQQIIDRSESSNVVDLIYQYQVLRQQFAARTFLDIQLMREFGCFERFAEAINKDVGEIDVTFTEPFWQLCKGTDDYPAAHAAPAQLAFGNHPPTLIADNPALQRTLIFTFGFAMPVPKGQNEVDSLLDGGSLDSTGDQRGYHGRELAVALAKEVMHGRITGCEAYGYFREVEGEFFNWLLSTPSFFEEMVLRAEVDPAASIAEVRGTANDPRIVRNWKSDIVTPATTEILLPPFASSGGALTLEGGGKSNIPPEKRVAFARTVAEAASEAIFRGVSRSESDGYMEQIRREARASSSAEVSHGEVSSDASSSE